MYAVNINHMKERHLDGTVLVRQSVGGIFEPLARPDLLITDAERVSVITSRRRDRDEALIGLVHFPTFKRCILTTTVQIPSLEPCHQDIPFCFLATQALEC